MTRSAILRMVVLCLTAAVGQIRAQVIQDRTDFHLLDFTPNNGASVTKNTKVPFVATGILVLSDTDSVYYRADLTVNGKGYSPFEFRTLPLTSGTSEIDGNMKWFVHVKGPRKMIVRVHLTGESFVGQKHYNFSDTTQTLMVSCNSETASLLRSLERLFHRCY